MIRKIVSACCLVAILASGCSSDRGGKPAPAIAPDETIESAIKEKLGKMSLEEKVGQMTQITIDVVTDMPASWSTGKFTLSQGKLDTIIGIHKVGSLLNVPMSVAQTRETYHDMMVKVQEMSMKEIGIPCIFGLDQIHGVTYVLGGTLFPQNINIAASFNPAHARKAGEITAYETRAASVPWSFSPVVDLGRDPRWSRQWENFGEDPLMNSVFGTEAVLGMQGNDPNHVDQKHIAACVKHFMGYGVPRSGKDRTPSAISEAEMREKHFAPYVSAIRNGALSVMVNSANNNGVPFHANKELLTDWLKEGLNWDGLIVTDWADINNLYTRDHVAADQKEAIEMAINAGIDMSMVPYDTSFCTDLIELVNEGRVPMSRIDDAVARVLRLKYRLDLFEHPYQEISEYPEFGSEAFAAAALEAAVESEVLLKNEGNLLPLKEGTRILVAGPNANSMRALNGGWSYSWQGDKADACASGYNTIYEALCEEFGKGNVTLCQGVEYATGDGSDWQADSDTGISAAVAAASRADVIVACVGENSYCETPGNMDDLSLSPNQTELVKRLAATGKPVVLVLNEGRPRIVRDLVPLCKAVVDILLPGNYGGDALALLLAGKANFSAKLPITYPKYVNALYTYDHKPAENIGEAMEGNYNYDAKMNIQWPFGYGLSYTDYEYSNIAIDKKEFGPEDELTITVDVANKGNVAGKEPVLLFSRDVVASVSPDNIRLRGFDKIGLQPGEKKTVTFRIPASDLAFVGSDNKWRIEKGDFRFRVGNQWVEARCLDTKVFDTPDK
ncbi:MAG: glycoside hydrolase family 3 C-terminal domain-containing protein [Muribaculaceae bacterium]|nr:glycoside hydrolase family 3 C-terminal domain-containing protein [Muribaculaceae bacterium]MDE6771491.1 glycoside hydrolase family 3 C-terminal domain-containing protein [Muribaculaceae bacterium]